MAVAKMSVFELTGLLSEKDALLDALQKTQSVELTFTESAPEQPTADREMVSAAFSRAKKCIEYILAQSDNLSKEERDSINAEGLSQDIFVSYEEFENIGKKSKELLNIIEQSEEFARILSEKRAERNKIANLKAQLQPYLSVKDKFSEFRDTQFVKCRFGLISDALLPDLERFAENEPLSEIIVYSRARQSAVAVFVHESCAEQADTALSELSFSKCNFDYEMTASEKIAQLDEQTERLLSEEEELSKKVFALSEHLKELKIYCDYLSYAAEKAEAGERFFNTRSTFTLKGYVPEEEKGRVMQAVNGVTDAAVIRFFAPEEGETPPTLLKNRGPAKAAEFVTNMYSAPDYREFDPNGFVFFFFMIFFGLIMADIGYGVLMFIGGLILLSRLKVENGMKKLVRIITYGGLFTVLFGALFGSCFGFSLYTFLPDPSSGNRTNVLIILLGCLALGLLQITVGYMLNAVNALRQGRIMDALCDSFTWILFDVGLFFAVFNFITGYFDIPVAAGVKEFFDTMTLPGVIMLGVGLVGAMLTAGRKEKFLGKFIKGFGALYGVINLLSDVLSYARLFGLMLSGMIIAQQFNGIGMDLIGAGGVGFVFGPVVMVIGHVFNIAMGVLGAYIHDCRLQYIEFFSKFYTGEGELFTPLGSRFQYIHFTK